MERLRGIKAVIHDWDGCVVDTYPPFLKLVYRLASGSQLSRNFIVGLWPIINQDWSCRLYGRYLTATRYPKPFSGVGESIRVLRERGYVLGVVSSSPRAILEKTIRQNPGISLEGYQIIQTGDDTEVRKPNPRVFVKILDQLGSKGLHLSEILHVADGINDYRLSRSLGMRFVATTTGFATQEHFMEAGLDAGLILPSFNRLPGFLSELPAKAA